MVVLGDVLAGKYRVERILGSGGMGIVVAARHLQLDVLIAVKLMTDEAREDLDLVARFIREGRAAARLRSEHIARVTDVGTLESGAPYQVMEYLEGYDLSQVLSRTGPLSIALATEYLVQACEALEEAHAAGIVHRDIKPSNLFLTTRPNGTPCVKLLDFGISKGDLRGGLSNKLHGTHSRTLLGTPFYMAPEQMRASRDADARADIWALGATLYELLTGRLPFRAHTLIDLAFKVAQSHPRPPHLIRAEIPPALEDVLLRCLEKERDARFSSARELGSALVPFAWRSSGAPEGSMSDRPEGARVDGAPDARAAVARAPFAPRSPGEVSTSEGPKWRDEIAKADIALVSASSLPPPPRAFGARPYPVMVGPPRPWLRTGAKVSWGGSAKSSGKRPMWWGAAAVLLLVSGGGLTVGMAMSHGARQRPTLASIRSDAPPVPRAPDAPSSAGRALNTRAQTSTDPALSPEPSSHIPMVSVSDLPEAPYPVFAPAPPAPIAPAAPPPPAMPRPSAEPVEASTQPNCDAPTYVDGRGITKFKTECLDSPLFKPAPASASAGASDAAAPAASRSPRSPEEPLPNPN